MLALRPLLSLGALNTLLALRALQVAVGYPLAVDGIPDVDVVRRRSAHAVHGTGLGIGDGCLEVGQRVKVAKNGEAGTGLAGITLVALFAGRANGAFDGRERGQRKGRHPVGRAFEVHLAVVCGGRTVREDQDELPPLDVRSGEVLIHLGHALILLGDADRHTGGGQPRVDLLAGVGGCVIVLQLGKDLLQNCDSLFKRHGITSHDKKFVQAVKKQSAATLDQRPCFCLPEFAIVQNDTAVRAWAARAA